MRNAHGLAGSITALTLLVGCAAQPPAPMAAAAPAMTPTAETTAAAGTIDGVYRSPPGGITGNARCGTTRFGYPVVVKGGVASMKTAINGIFEGPVGPDGSINIERGRANLQGQIANGQFNGNYGAGGGCSYALAYAKR